MSTYRVARNSIQSAWWDVERLVGVGPFAQWMPQNVFPFRTKEEAEAFYERLTRGGPKDKSGLGRLGP